ncbi:MAG: hypothetical protein Q4F05_11885 [bacterium]|nr:hypothetical protein [bacterium]
MDYIHHKASAENSSDAKSAVMAVDGITSVRGAATHDLYKMQEKADSEKKEVDSCLNTVTCRIM